MDTNRKGKKRSSYKNKAPFAYSALYHEWADAARAGNHGKADDLSRRHLLMCARQAPLAESDRYDDPNIAINKQARNLPRAA